MRIRPVDRSEFLEGVLTGLAAAGVALFAGVAIRRVLAVRRARAEEPLLLHIDGARPLSTAAYDARPQEEGSSMIRLLESELPDFPIDSQRW